MNISKNIIRNNYSYQINLIFNLFILFVLTITNSYELNAKESLSVEHGEKLLRQLEIEKHNFLKRIDFEENKCLGLFLSGPCLEKLTIKHDSKIRDIEQQKQIILRKVRRFKSDLRKKKRENKLKYQKDINGSLN